MAVYGDRKPGQRGRRHMIRLRGVMAVLGLGLFASTVAADRSSAADKPIVIGAIYNLTGGQRDLDIPSLQGARLAVDEANAAGGVRGRPFKLIAIDGQTDPKVISREARKLLADEAVIPGLFGLSDTDMVLAAARVAAAKKRLFLTSGATSPKLPQQVPRYLFLACFGDNVQAAAGAEFAFNNLNARTVVVLYKQTASYTRLLQGYFRTRFEQLGGKVLMVRSYATANFANRLNGLPKADLVYLAAQPDELPVAIPALRDAGITAPVLGGDGLDIGANWKGVAQADHIYFTTHAYLGADNPDSRVQAFRARFAKANPGKEPDAFAALGYDAAGLMLAAIAKAGSTDPYAVRRALAATTDFPGVTGAISYRNGSRIPVKPVAVIAVKQGQQSLAASVLPDKVPAP